MTRWTTPILALFLATGCAEGPDPAARGDRPGNAQVATAAAEAPENVVYVDVRTAEEFAAGHVRGAIHIPYTEMQARHGELAQFADDEIVVYCRTGRRSGIAQEILHAEGFENVTNGGGLTDLQRQGVPTAR